MQNDDGISTLCQRDLKDAKVIFEVYEMNMG